MPSVQHSMNSSCWSQAGLNSIFADQSGPGYIKCEWNKAHFSKKNTVITKYSQCLCSWADDANYILHYTWRRLTRRREGGRKGWIQETAFACATRRRRGWFSETLPSTVANKLIIVAAKLTEWFFFTLRLLPAVCYLCGSPTLVSTAFTISVSPFNYLTWYMIRSKRHLLKYSSTAFACANCRESFSIRRLTQIIVVTATDRRSCRETILLVILRIFSSACLS